MIGEGGAHFALPIAYGCGRPDRDVRDDALDEPSRWLCEALEAAVPMAQVRTDFDALTFALDAQDGGDGAHVGAEPAVPSALVDCVAKHVAAEAPTGAVVRLDNCGYDGRGEGGPPSLTRYFEVLEDVRRGALDGFVDDERGDFFCMHLAHAHLVKNRNEMPSIEPYDVVGLAEGMIASASPMSSPTVE